MTLRGDGADALDEEGQFLRDARAKVDHELFMSRFANWRMSVIAALVVGCALGGLYYFLTDSRLPLVWAALYCGAFLLIGSTCWVYEGRPAAVDSVSQQRWVLAWAVLSGLCGHTGAATGHLCDRRRADSGARLRAAAARAPAVDCARKHDVRGLRAGVRPQAQ
jgi:hypothetical protein